LKDVHLKAYIHQSLVETEKWAQLERDFELKKLGKPLTSWGNWLTPGGIGVGICGFVTNGAKSDKKHYDQQSVPGPKQHKVGPPEKRVRPPERGGGQEEEEEKYRVKGGKHHQRLRDIRTRMYGIAESPGDKGWGRAVYEHVLKYLGIGGQIKSGKRDDPTFKKQAEWTEEEAALVREKKREKRRRERERKRVRAQELCKEGNALAQEKKRQKRRRECERKRARALGLNAAPRTVSPQGKRLCLFFPMPLLSQGFSFPSLFFPNFFHILIYKSTHRVRVSDATAGLSKMVL
jgi:hypothetical protein